jgi:hypothetical protein
MPRGQMPQLPTYLQTYKGSYRVRRPIPKPLQGFINRRQYPHGGDAYMTHKLRLPGEPKLTDYREATDLRRTDTSMKNEGQKMLAGALGLILSGEAGPIMSVMADAPNTCFTYEITPLPPPAPPDSYNWRLITTPA